MALERSSGINLHTNVLGKASLRKTSSPDLEDKSSNTRLEKSLNLLVISMMPCSEVMEGKHTLMEELKKVPGKEVSSLETRSLIWKSFLNLRKLTWTSI